MYGRNIARERERGKEKNVEVVFLVKETHESNTIFVVKEVGKEGL